MEHILSLSYGKDSLACLGAIEESGLPLDRIVHAEVWATDTIPADLPEMVEFKKKADKIIFEKFGLNVEHIRSEITFEELFYKKWKSGSKNEGKIYGFPTIAAKACTSQLKTNLLKKSQKNCITYIGIAIDEPARFHNFTENIKSPLVEAGWTEEMCRKWCEDNDLLSPIYTTASRGGCWFCPNQRVEQLRLLRKNHPDLWELLLKWDGDSPVSFKADGHTVHDFDRRFKTEENGIIPHGKKFRWSMLDIEKSIRERD